MDGIRFLNLHFIGLVGLGILNAQIVPPVLIDKTEPEYNADFKNYVVDPARVQMIVDERGNPFALNSTTSLPDNVVQALAKWRFRPGMKNRTDTLIMQAVPPISETNPGSLPGKLVPV